jgi:hypothetical protein
VAAAGSSAGSSQGRQRPGSSSNGGGRPARLRPSATSDAPPPPTHLGCTAWAQRGLQKEVHVPWERQGGRGEGARAEGVSGGEGMGVGMQSAAGTSIRRHEQGQTPSAHLLRVEEVFIQGVLAPHHRLLLVCLAVAARPGRKGEHNTFKNFRQWPGTQAATKLVLLGGLLRRRRCCRCCQSLHAGAPEALSLARLPAKQAAQVGALLVALTWRRSVALRACSRQEGERTGGSRTTLGMGVPSHFGAAAAPA